MKAVDTRKIDLTNKVQDSQSAIKTIDSRITDLNNKQIAGDYFYMNNASFSITNKEQIYAKFCVKSGNTLNF